MFSASFKHGITTETRTARTATSSTTLRETLIYSGHTTNSTPRQLKSPDGSTGRATRVWARWARAITGSFWVRAAAVRGKLVAALGLATAVIVVAGAAAAAALGLARRLGRRAERGRGIGAEVGATAASCLRGRVLVTTTALGLAYEALVVLSVWF